MKGKAMGEVIDTLLSMLSEGSQAPPVRPSDKGTLKMTSGLLEANGRAGTWK
jgi:hypothetical protein